MALGQQDHTDFEIVVVVDADSLRRLDDKRIKAIRFDDANLSKARNLGIAQSAGDVCAFIDDDAIAEPTWLRHLDAAFRSTSADAVTGFVRGRNGISFQSKAHVVDTEAETHALKCDEEECSVPDVPENTALKLVGTNMAIRRRVLNELGGFDESLRFFLDDTDISMRLTQAGWRSAIQPLAQVHHGFAPSGRRTARRAPLDLSDVGRSTAIFLRKFAGGATGEHWNRIEGRERRRLLKHLVAGTCEPRDVGIRMAGLQDGWTTGLEAEFGSAVQFPDDADFRPFPPCLQPQKVFSAPFLSRRASLIAQAERVVRSGGRASVFSFSLTPVRHHVKYTSPGIWIQTGGVYGRSERTKRNIGWCRFADRLQAEIRRVAKFRGIGET